MASSDIVGSDDLASTSVLSTAATSTPSSAALSSAADTSSQVAVSRPASEDGPLSPSAKRPYVAGDASPKASSAVSSTAASPTPSASSSAPVSPTPSSSPSSTGRSKASGRNRGPGNQQNIKRIQRELMAILSNPPANCSASPHNDSLNTWVATMMGPDGSPYESGIFNLEIRFPSDYPFSPPKVTFKTKIYHCNISNTGEICLDILKDKWSVAMTVEKVLLSVSALLGDCNPKDPLVPDIAKLYLKDRKLHDEMAREWTERYAQ